MELRTATFAKRKKVFVQLEMNEIVSPEKPIISFRLTATVFIVLWIFLPFFAAGQSIQNKIDFLLEQEQLTGTVYSIVRDGHITCYSSGLKNIATKDSLFKDDKVHVGSITKTFLAMGILRMATENMLQLDDPIKKYLKDIPMNNPWESSHPVTIRHLLDHTSGLSDIRLWHFFSTGATPQTPLSEFYRRDTKVLDIHVKPGTLFSYSNMGYTLLGMLVEAIAKEPYENYLDKNLLQPIGLMNSTFRFNSQYNDKKQAMGHFDKGRLAVAMPIFVRPAGQFATTAQDMGKFLGFILNGGRINGKEFIRKDFIDQLGMPTQTIAAKNGLRLGYALGALSRDRYGVVGIVHSGNIIGFRAMYYLFPKEKKAFFIAHNMDSETADYEVFNQALIDNLDLNVTPGAVSQELNNPNVLNTRWNGYYVPVFTKIQPMELLDVISSYTSVKKTEDALSIQPFQKNEILLKTKDGRLFFAHDKTQASHLFYKDKYGESYLTTGTKTLKKISGLKIFLTVISITAGVLACVLLLLGFIISLGRKQWSYFKSPAAFCTSTLLLFVLSVIIISSAGITRIGNRSMPGMLLYCSTFLLPAGSFLPLIRFSSMPSKSIRRLDFWLILLIAQFVSTLWLYNLIPFVIWK